MAIPDGQVNTEPIPFLLMPVTKMGAESIPKVAGKTHIIESIPFVQRVYAMPLPNKVTNDFLMLFKSLPCYFLQKLADKRSWFGHNQIIP